MEYNIFNRIVYIVSCIFIGAMAFALGSIYSNFKHEPKVVEVLVEKIVEVPDESPMECLAGKLQLFSMGKPEVEGRIIGDQIVCARDWQVSGIFGPSIDAHFERENFQGVVIKKAEWDRWIESRKEHEEWHKKHITK